MTLKDVPPKSTARTEPDSSPDGSEGSQEGSISKVEFSVSPSRPRNIWRSMLSVMHFEVVDDTARAFRSYMKTLSIKYKCLQSRCQTVSWVIEVEVSSKHPDTCVTQRGSLGPCPVRLYNGRTQVYVQLCLSLANSSRLTAGASRLAAFPTRIGKQVTDAHVERLTF